MSNNVLVTGNLIVQGTNNIPGSANITNNDSFIITNQATTNSFLVSTGASSATWSLLSAKNFESSNVHVNSNVTLTSDDNIFQSMQGNGGTYEIRLPVGLYGTTFVIGKLASNNTVHIRLSGGSLVKTIPSGVPNECNIFIANYPNAWAYFENTGFS